MGNILGPYPVSSQNYPTPPRECKITNGGPCEPCISLSNIDAEIVMTEPWLEEHLVTRRHEILAAINQSHDLITSRLPVEVISDVFRHCLPNPPSPEFLERSMPDDSYLRMASKLVSVCQIWRSIGCSTSCLWSTICFSYNKERYSVYLANMKRQFLHSGSHPLTVHITFGPDQSSPESLNIVKELCNQAHRWKMLDLTASLDAILIIQRRTSNVVLDQLSSLNLGSYYANDALGFSLGNQNGPLPSLSYISLCRVDLSVKSFNLDRLVSLKLHQTATSYLLSYLSASPCLQTLTCSPIRSTGFPKIPHILRHLALKTLCTNFHPGLFAQIALPSLETLICYGIDKGHYDTLYGFLIRSQCSLQFLKIHTNCDEEDFLNLLRLTPHLTALEIRGTITPHFFQYLGKTAHQDTDEPPFLPRLQSLAFLEYGVAGKFEWSLLQKMVPTYQEALDSTSRHLSKVTVWVYSDMDLQRIMEPAGQANVGRIIDETGLEIQIRDQMRGPDAPDVSRLYGPVREALERLRIRKTHTFG